VTATWALAALWLGLALAATLLSIWLRVATALSEIVVGAIAQLLIGALVGGAALGGSAWYSLPYSQWRSSASGPRCASGRAS